MVSFFILYNIDSGKLDIIMLVHLHSPVFTN